MGSNNSAIGDTPNLREGQMWCCKRKEKLHNELDNEMEIIKHIGSCKFCTKYNVFEFYYKELTVDKEYDDFINIFKRFKNIGKFLEKNELDGNKNPFSNVKKDKNYDIFCINKIIWYSKIITDELYEEKICKYTTNLHKKYFKIAKFFANLDYEIFP